jgi:hypothetical protein
MLGKKKTFLGTKVVNNITALLLLGFGKNFG